MLRTITVSLTLAMAATICLPSQGSDPTCGGDGRNACGTPVCPHCGFRLVPVCHPYCTTKEVITYKHCCICEDICIPGITPLGQKRQGCETSGEPAGRCGACNIGCPEGCGGRCLVRTVHKLVKFPVTKEVPVKKCAVEWACPHCNCQGGCVEGTAPSSPTPPVVAPAPMPPPPAAVKSAARPSPNDSAGRVVPLRPVF
jgi:hypothetical protein